MKLGLGFLILLSFAAWGATREQQLRESVAAISAKIDSLPQIVFDKNNQQTFQRFLDKCGHAEYPDREVREIFTAIQRANFGGERFLLRGCEDVQGAQSDVARRMIYISPEFLRKAVAGLPNDIQRELIAMVLAHEIGHYIYEQMVLGSPGSRSHYGFRSWLDPKINFDEQTDSHGEVDVIGIILMAPAGFQPPEPVFMFKRMAEAAPPFLYGRIQISGVQERIRMIQQYLSGLSEKVGWH